MILNLFLSSGGSLMCMLNWEIIKSGFFVLLMWILENWIYGVGSSLRLVFLRMVMWCFRIWLV